jgi:hypothetical protein
MESVVGIFDNRHEALRAAADLRAAGIDPERVNVLVPGDAGDPAAAASVPTSDTEQAGLGKAIGGVVGGVAGATAGMGLGGALATLLVPGVGPVAAAGLAAAALFGAGGVLGGAAAGGALEKKMSHGLPKDELYVYEDALRKGHSVVFVLPETDEESKAARARLSSDGAESIDAAKEDWWVGLRDAEAAEYEKDGSHFDRDEPAYRKGFEAALHPERRGRAYDAAHENLAACFGPDCDQTSFRRGYERGQAHARGLSEKFEEADTGEYAHRR